MYERDVGSIIITHNDRETLVRQSVGMVTARYFVNRVVAHSKGPFKVVLKDILSTPLITINKDALISDAIMLMKDKNIARLPMISEPSEVLGIVSFLRTLVSRAEQISSISA